MIPEKEMIQDVIICYTVETASVSFHSVMICAALPAECQRHLSYEAFWQVLPSFTLPAVFWLLPCRYCSASTMFMTHAWKDTKSFSSMCQRMHVFYSTSVLIVCCI